MFTLDATVIVIFSYIIFKKDQLKVEKDFIN